MKRLLAYCAMGVAVTILFGKVGQMDMQDKQEEEKRYCDMVRDGVWPDFDKKYREMCKKYVV